MNTPIGTLGLEPETIQVLVKGGVKTAEDIVAMSPSKLRRLPNFARRHLNDVKRALAEKGITFQEF